jgi:hypothetical protein
MLREYDLTYVIRGDALLITTKEHAPIDRRVFPVRDLLIAEGADPATASSNGERLAEIVASFCSPEARQDRGPPCMVECVPGAGALVVSADDETHEYIESFLWSLREIRDSQTKTKGN